jgi:hypothetical protein
MNSPRHAHLPNRHARAGENPVLFPAELAWITAFAGMTEPRRRFVTQIIRGQIFSKEDMKNPKFGIFIILNLRGLRAELLRTND